MPKLLKKPKKTHGGARSGAGRKPTGKVIDKTKWVRCSTPVSDALDDHMEAYNADRQAAGLKKESFSRWASEVLLRAIGREDLID